MYTTYVAIDDAARIIIEHCCLHIYGKKTYIDM